MKGEWGRVRVGEREGGRRDGNSHRENGKWGLWKIECS